MAYFLDNYPVLEESADLVLTEEQEKNCRVVYKLDDEGGAYFSGLWDPDMEYSDEFVIVPFRSTGGTLTTIDAGKAFANVLNSTRDPKPSGVQTWIGYWLSLTGTTGGINQCCTDGNFYSYYIKDRAKVECTLTYVVYKNELEKAVCNNKIDGGHIILGTEAATVLPGGKVYILPICDKHNYAKAKDGLSPGEGFHMKLNAQTSAIELNGYLTNVRCYIDKLK